MATKKTSKSKKDSLLDSVVLLGSSLAYLTKGATDEIIDVLEKNKVLSTKEGKAAVEKAKSELKARQADVRKTVSAELGKVIDQLGIATKKDLESLKRKPATKAKPTVRSKKTKTTKKK